MASETLGQNTHSRSNGHLTDEAVTPSNVSQSQSLGVVAGDSTWYRRIIPSESSGQAENPHYPSVPFRPGIRTGAYPTQPGSDLQFTWHPDNEDVPPAYQHELSSNTLDASLAPFSQEQLDAMGPYIAAKSAAGYMPLATVQRPIMANPPAGPSIAARPNSAPLAQPGTSTSSVHSIPPRPSTSYAPHLLTTRSSMTSTHPNGNYTAPRLRVHPSAMPHQSGPLNLRMPITSAPVPGAAAGGFPFYPSAYPMYEGNYTPMYAGIPQTILNVSLQAEHANLQLPGVISQFQTQYRAIPNGFPLSNISRQHLDGITQGGPPIGSNFDSNLPGENVYYSQPVVPPSLYQNIPMEPNRFWENVKEQNKHSDSTGQVDGSYDEDLDTSHFIDENPPTFSTEGSSKTNQPRRPKGKRRQSYELPPRFLNARKRPRKDASTSAAIPNCAPSSPPPPPISDPIQAPSDAPANHFICLWRTCGRSITKPAGKREYGRHFKNYHGKDLGEEEILCQWIDYNIKMYNPENSDDQPVSSEGLGEPVTCGKRLKYLSLHKHICEIHFDTLGGSCTLCSMSQARTDNMPRHLMACRKFLELGEAEQKAKWGEMVKKRNYEDYFVEGKPRPEKKGGKGTKKGTKRGRKPRGEE